MKIEQVIKMVDENVKVYFKPHDKRYPMIGKFVYLQDGKHLESKKMIRFIREDRIEDWDGTSVYPTSIYVVTDFKMIESKGKSYL